MGHCLPNCLRHTQELLTTAPVLSYPRFGPESQFILETDESFLGLGAVLAQKQDGQVQPLAYASRTLNPQEKNYGITEMETLAVVWAAKHLHPYLLGHHCTVFHWHRKMFSRRGAESKQVKTRFTCA